MNVIRDSMEEIRASKELKRNTMEYLRNQQRYYRARMVRRYVLAAACICLFLLGGGYTLYARPVSYISIDVNPSIELGINCFGRVVEADAYNRDGNAVLMQVPLKNVPYLKAISRLLGDESYSGYLTEDSRVFITVISERWEIILEEIRADELAGRYGAQTYTSDLTCREEAHQYRMSFGKYRACLELSKYDESVTVEECHGMSMGEIEDRIETCKGHGNGNRGEGGHRRKNRGRGCQNDGSYEDYEDYGNDDYDEYNEYDEYDEYYDGEGHEGHHRHGNSP